MLNVKQLELASSISQEVLNRLRQAVCFLPLEPMALCENNCRECPEGYICAYFLRPAAGACLQERGCEDLFIIQPGPKRCIELPTR